jgi:hypothetical protein
MQIDQTKIRERAYALWEQEGRFDGRAQDHWYRAERELAQAAASAEIAAPAPAEAAATKAAAPKRRTPATEKAAATKVAVAAKTKRAAKPQVLHS